MYLTQEMWLWRKKLITGGGVSDFVEEEGPGESSAEYSHQILIKSKKIISEK